MNRKKIAALYTRVSTKEQAVEGYSIDEQEKLLKSYCGVQDYDVYRLYTDRGISGKSIEDRPGIQALLQDAEKGVFDVVVVWKLNRLSRKLINSMEITEKLRSFNIQLKSVTEKWDISTAQGRLQQNIMSSFSEFEREQIAENVKMGMSARAKDGRWNGGIVLGYDLVEVKEPSRKRSDKILVINKKEAEAVKHIFELYYNGNGYKSIANRINKEGYTTKKDNYFGVCSVREILLNPLYCGKIRYNLRQDWSTKRRKGLNADPILVEGIHEPIITREMFQKVQDLIKSKGGKSSRSFDGSYPLTGIIRCPVCNSGMVAGRVSSMRKDGTKRTIRYYYCGAWRNKGIAACRSNGVRADDVEKYVFSKIQRLVTSDAFLKATLQNANEKRRKKIQPAEDRVKGLDKRIRALQDNRNNYFKLMENKVIKPEDIVPRLQEISEQISKLEAEKAIQEGYMNFSEIEDIPFDLVKKTLEEFEALLKKSASNEERKTLLHLLIDEIKVGPDRRAENVVIKFNSILVNFIKENGGLPDEGNPLLLYKNMLDMDYFDFKMAI